MSACTCPCPECGDINAEAMKACCVLQADLDDAQDEIERLIGERQQTRTFCLQTRIDSEDIVCTRHEGHHGDHGGFPVGPGAAAVPLRWDRDGSWA